MTPGIATPSQILLCYITRRDDDDTSDDDDERVIDAVDDDVSVEDARVQIAAELNLQMQWKP